MLTSEVRPRGICQFSCLTWGGVGWGGDVNVYVKLQKHLMRRTRGVGWGGMGWDVNVQVNLQKQLMLRTRGVGGGVAWGC